MHGSSPTDVCYGRQVVFIKAGISIRQPCTDIRRTTRILALGSISFICYIRPPHLAIIYHAWSWYLMTHGNISCVVTVPDDTRQYIMRGHGI